MCVLLIYLCLYIRSSNCDRWIRILFVIQYFPSLTLFVHYRAAAEIAEAFAKRTRNASGSRPLSGMGGAGSSVTGENESTSFRFGDEEKSYGYLLQPSKVNFNATTSLTNVAVKGVTPPHRQKLMEMHGFHNMRSDSMDANAKKLYFQR